MNAGRTRVAGVSLALPHVQGRDPYSDMENALLAEVVAGLAPRRRERPVAGVLSFTAHPGHLSADGPVTGWGVRSTASTEDAPVREDATPPFPIHSKRGPRTARLLSPAASQGDEVFGDPLLAFRWARPDLEHVARVKTTDVLVAQCAADSLQDSVPFPFRLLDVTAGPEDVLREVIGARFVVGDWLPAIAIAEAFGIETRLVASGPVDRFDHRDYLAGTGRPVETIADSVAEALELGAQARPVIDVEALVRAFPHDLWTARRRMPTTETLAVGGRGDLHRTGLPSEASRVATLPRAEATAEYGQVLSATLDSGDLDSDSLAEVPRGDELSRASAVIEQRIWSYPHVRRDELPEHLRSLDAAVCRGNEKDLVEFLARVRGGFRAFVHHVERHGASLVAGLTLGVPELVRRIEAVTIHCEDDRVMVPGYLLPGDHLGHLDLDVVLPGEWEGILPSDSSRTALTVEITWADGDRTSVPLEAAQAAPSLFSRKPDPHREGE